MSWRKQLLEGELCQPVDVAVAAVLSTPFALYLTVLNLATTPTEEQWQAADPIVTLAPRLVVLWGVPLVGLLLGVCWHALIRPRAVYWRSLGWALAGALSALLVVGTLRLAAGPRLPHFIPPEEGAAPGFLLSLTAGYAEELLFRLILAPLLFYTLKRKLRSWLAMVLSILFSALAFALFHAVGEAAFSSTLFFTRFLVPGCMMGVAFFVLRPPFIVLAHCTAHLVLPLFFV